MRKSNCDRAKVVLEGAPKSEEPLVTGDDLQQHPGAASILRDILAATGEVSKA